MSFPLVRQLAISAVDSKRVHASTRMVCKSKVDPSHMQGLCCGSWSPRYFPAELGTVTCSAFTQGHTAASMGTFLIFGCSTGAAESRNEQAGRVSLHKLLSLLMLRPNAG